SAEQERIAAAGAAAVETILATARPGVAAADVARAAGEVLAPVLPGLVFHHNFGYPVGIGYPGTWIEALGFFLRVDNPRPLAPGKEPPGGIQAEARQALSNIRAIVEGCGGSLANAVKVQLFLRDMADFAAVNAVWPDFFPEPWPARTTIQSNIAYSLAVDVVV